MIAMGVLDNDGDEFHHDKAHHYDFLLIPSEPVCRAGLVRVVNGWVYKPPSAFLSFLFYTAGDRERRGVRKERRPRIDVVCGSILFMILGF